MRNKEPWAPQGPASSGTSGCSGWLWGEGVPLGSVRELQGDGWLVTAIMGPTGYLAGDMGKGLIVRHIAFQAHEMGLKKGCSL